MHSFKCNYSIYDLQSAGMVCFYTMSRGTHPFAPDDDFIMTHHNIMKGRYDLSAIEDFVGCHLVEQMLACKPSDRPTAGELLR